MTLTAVDNCLVYFPTDAVRLNAAPNGLCRRKSGERGNERNIWIRVRPSSEVESAWLTFGPRTSRRFPNGFCIRSFLLSFFLSFFISFILSFFPSFLLSFFFLSFFLSRPFFCFATYDVCYADFDNRKNCDDLHYNVQIFQYFEFQNLVTYLPTHWPITHWLHSMLVFDLLWIHWS